MTTTSVYGWMAPPSTSLARNASTPPRMATITSPVRPGRMPPVEVTLPRQPMGEDSTDMDGGNLERSGPRVTVGGLPPPGPPALNIAPALACPAQRTTWTGGPDERAGQHSGAVGRRDQQGGRELPGVGRARSAPGGALAR